MIFIVVQNTLERQEILNNTVHNYWNTIVRQVESETREQAIGKFVIGTSEIKSIQKMEILCYPLSMLNKI